MLLPGKVGVVHIALAGHGIGDKVFSLHFTEGQEGEVLKVGETLQLSPGEGQDVMPQDQSRKQHNDDGKVGEGEQVPLWVGGPVLQGDALLQLPEEEAQLPLFGEHRREAHQQADTEQYQGKGYRGNEIGERGAVFKELDACTPNDKKCEQGGHDGPPSGIFIELLPPLPLKFRVGVELRGLFVLGGEDEHLPVHIPHTLPAVLLVEFQHVGGQVVIQAAAIWFDPVPGFPGRAGGEGTEEGAVFFQVQPPQGHVLKPALQPLDVVVGDRGELVDRFHVGPPFRP